MGKGADERMRTEYSTAFKRKVVQEIEEGKLRVEEANRLYGIKGHSTISKWLKAMGRNHKIGKVVRIETEKEYGILRELEKEKKQLESALAGAYLRIISLEKTIDVLNREYGGDVKKK
ncbi:MAG: transposase [Bacteroidales bacterium]